MEKDAKNCSKNWTFQSWEGLDPETIAAIQRAVIEIARLAYETSKLQKAGRCTKDKKSEYETAIQSLLVIVREWRQRKLPTRDAVTSTHAHGPDLSNAQRRAFRRLYDLVRQALQNPVHGNSEKFLEELQYWTRIVVADLKGQEDEGEQRREEDTSSDEGSTIDSETREQYLEARRKFGVVAIHFA